MTLRMILFIPFLLMLSYTSLSCSTTDPEYCDKDCFIETGIASWYGFDYPPRCTANGETYNGEALTAAHKTLPFNTLVRVENQKNGKSVTVRINDRGPFIKGRVIDLSKKAAEKIGILTTGLTEVEIYLVKESENPEPDYTQGCEEL